MRNIREIVNAKGLQILQPLTFGKYSGKYLWELPPDYMDWIEKSYGLTAGTLGKKAEDALAIKKNNERNARRAADPNISIELDQHQRDFLRAFGDRDCGLLSIPIGGGKTRAILAMFLARREPDDKMIVFCPKSVMGGWQNEAQKICPEINTVIISGTAKEKIQKMQIPAKIYITNYESVLNDDVYIELYMLRALFVAVDESHRIKNYRRKTTSGGDSIASRIVDLGNASRYRYAITGTPLARDESAIYQQALFLDGGLTFGNSFPQFYNRYYTPGKFGYYSGYFRENVRAEFLQKMSTLVFSVDRKQYDKTIQPIYETRHCELTGENLRSYFDILKNAATIIDSEEITVENKISEITRLRQIVGGGVNEHRVKSNKIEALVDFLQDIFEPVVIACAFRHEVDDIKNALEKIGKTYRCLTGGMSNSEFEKNRAEFSAGGIDVMILSIQAGGTGVDGLQYASSIMIFFSNTYSEVEREQCEGRIYRKGQKNQCVFIDLLSHYVSKKNNEPVKCIDHYVLEAVRKKQANSQFLLDSVRAMYANF